MGIGQSSRPGPWIFDLDRDSRTTADLVRNRKTKAELETARKAERAWRWGSF